MTDTGVIAIAVTVVVVPVIVYVAIRHVTNAIDVARVEAGEAWKQALAEREIRARAEATVMRLDAELARHRVQLPLPAPVDDAATAPVSPDTLAAILRQARSNGDHDP